MTNLDPNSLIMGSGARSAKFASPGDRIWGTIVGTKTMQQKDMQGQLMFWPDGNPKLQVAITLLTELVEDDEDDGLRTVYARGQMMAALRAAFVKAGVRGMEDGGRLLVQYMKDAEPTQKGFNGAKQYFAKYDPPTFTTELPDQPDDDDDLPF
jgi:hypothetical protein